VTQARSTAAGVTDLTLTTTAAKIQIWGAFPPGSTTTARWHMVVTGCGEHQPVRLPAELMKAIADQDGKVWLPSTRASDQRHLRDQRRWRRAVRAGPGS
jgi:hypothetical protein